MLEMRNAFIILLATEQGGKTTWETTVDGRIILLHVRFPWQRDVP
jgi:hypothetical protein